MNFLVDSSTIFDFFMGKTELFHLFDETENLYVSVVTVAELNYRARTAQTHKNAVQIADDFVHLLHIVNVDKDTALKYGELKEKYPLLETNKLWLCATAVVRDFVIITEDKEIAEVNEVVVKKFMKGE